MAKDPICGMYVDESSATITSVKYGRTYYFCSESCKKQFEKPELEFKRLKIVLFIAWAFTVPVFLLTYVIKFNGSLYLMLILASIVQFYPGLRFYKGTWDAIKNMAGNMDSLIAIGTSAAWTYSTILVLFPSLFPTSDVYFDTSTIIVALILTGAFMEHLTKARASEAVQKLISLQPKIAHRINGEHIEDVPIEHIKVGDVMLVKPGEAIPTDSVITLGATSVDEAMLTGESVPVDKKEGDLVIGGTINTVGSIQIKAEKVGTDTTLSQIIEVVESASTGKVPIQRLADKISSYFVPIVISVAIVAFIFWYYFGNIGLTFSVLVFVSVLIIACPCALGLATPAALMVGAGKAAKHGIIIKGGENLEIASKVDALVFDKTGTLTKGELEVTDIIPLSRYTTSEILKYAAIGEINSEHPLGKAVIKKAKSQNYELIFPEHFSYMPGKGITAEWNDKKIIIGNRDSLKEHGIKSEYEDQITTLEKQGKTVLIVVVNAEVVGLIGLSDTLKEDSLKTVTALNKMNIEIWMITGDNITTAKAIAERVHIKNIMANIKPMEKLQKIEELQKEGKIVAMVGDGINDAPALAKADLGIAIGSGTEIAKQTGGMILMKNSLYDVVVALKIARRTIRKIKQNLIWAFLYNSMLIPIAAGALIPIFSANIYDFLPILAALAMAFSSTTVVSNSLLLRLYKV